MSTDHCLAFCTCPDRGTATHLAERLVSERLAACVNIVPGLTSVYVWEGQLERAEETLLLIKTETASLPALEAALKLHHPYELPELIAVPITAGSAEYLRWISTCIESQP